MRINPVYIVFQQCSDRRAGPGILVVLLLSPCLLRGVPACWVRVSQEHPEKQGRHFLASSQMWVLAAWAQTIDMIVKL